jgi:hypothetical protein
VKIRKSMGVVAYFPKNKIYKFFISSFVALGWIEKNSRLWEPKAMISDPTPCKKAFRTCKCKW